ncbi:MAG: SDR family oxidoreductase [Crocinitomicaceae bacterium]|nr:SDR family oxidoreductase [Crocinitomicaceae bacterium]
MKNIVVIGASRGIGWELVKQLSKDNKVLAISRNQDRLAQLATESGCSIAAIDISSAILKTELHKAITSNFKSVDVLINNAGYLVNKSYDDLTLEDIQSIYLTNVFGVMLSCQAIIPFMNKGSHIVNIGSIGGVQGSVKFPGLSAYSSSKAAIAGYSECLAEELKDDEIQVNCLALGAVQTEMLAEAFPGYEAPTSAAEMAEFIADFSLRANQWLNGKIIPVSKSTP